MIHINTYFHKKDGIAWITFNRPKHISFLTLELLNEWKTAILGAVQDQEVGVIVVSDAGRVFSAGFQEDEQKVEELSVSGLKPELASIRNEIFKSMIAHPKAVIAMINGPCYTGGLVCLIPVYIAVASEQAVFSDSPLWDTNNTIDFKKKEPSGAAAFSANEALEMGTINRVVPSDQLKREVAFLAGKIIKNKLENTAVIQYLGRKGLSMTLQE
jgi:enoyl-CoA hydratase/carnithine racemase